MATALPLARRLFVSATPLLPDKWLWQEIRRAFGAPRGRRARVPQPWRVVVGTSLTSPQGKELDALKNVLGRPAPARELIYKPEPVLPAPAIPGAAPKARTRPCLAGSGLFMASGREPGRRGDCTAPSGLGPVRPTPSAVSVPGVCLPEPSTGLCAVRRPEDGRLRPARTPGGKGQSRQQTPLETSGAQARVPWDLAFLSRLRKTLYSKALPLQNKLRNLQRPPPPRERGRKVCELLGPEEPQPKAGGGGPRAGCRSITVPWPRVYRVRMATG